MKKKENETFQQTNAQILISFGLFVIGVETGSDDNEIDKYEIKKTRKSLLNF